MIVDHLYPFFSLLFAFTSLLVGLIVLFRRQDTVGWFYMLFSFCVGLWGIGYSLVLDNHIPDTIALPATQLHNAVASFIASSWFAFTMAYTTPLLDKN